MTAPERKRETSPVIRDPVCGREVHAEDIDAWVEYRGRRYFFCCPECRRTFEEKVPAGQSGKGESPE